MNYSDIKLKTNNISLSLILNQFDTIIKYYV